MQVLAHKAKCLIFHPMPVLTGTAESSTMRRRPATSYPLIFLHFRRAIALAFQGHEAARSTVTAGEHTHSGVNCTDLDALDQCQLFSPMSISLSYCEGGLTTTTTGGGRAGATLRPP